jgi:hypothetical protein
LDSNEMCRARMGVNIVRGEGVAHVRHVQESAYRSTGLAVAVSCSHAITPWSVTASLVSFSSKIVESRMIDKLYNTGVGSAKLMWHARSRHKYVEKVRCIGDSYLMIFDSRKLSKETHSLVAQESYSRVS